MARIRWTPQAADDLEAIAEFIGADSQHYARMVVLDLLTAIARLQQFPMMGRIVPESQNQSIREIILGSYRIIYRVVDDIVEILTIYHGSRLLDPKIFR